MDIHPKVAGWNCLTNIMELGQLYVKTTLEMKKQMLYAEHWDTAKGILFDIE